MKQNLTLFLICTALLIHPAAYAQSVNCSRTLLTTIQNFKVYEHDASGAIMFRAKMAIDADGSPRAYGPNNTGLDWTANAGQPGNWWGIVTDNNGNPVIQGSSDPYPGMYVSTTSLINSSYSSTNPLRYTNSEAVPFFVLPSALVQLAGISLGDYGYVYNTVTGQGCYAIFADGGPAGKLGEGSIYLANQVGVNSNARTGGTTQGIIDYIVFPGSGAGQGTIPSNTQINNTASSLLSVAGGTGITACLNPNPPAWDNTAPTTAITVPNNWITGNFTANFNDADNSGGSGLEKSYYQVIEFDGAEWHANAQRGFFADNFDSYSSLLWTTPPNSGTWQAVNGNLVQSDTSVSNTNTYASLNQNLSNRYLYHFNAMMASGTSGSNQHRFGLHFFCDDASQSDRGNSYFMFVRQETSVVEIYKVVNNTYSLVKTISSVATTFGQWYDYKIIFDRITGKISIYRNNALLGTWTDSNVLTTSGDYISFRTGHCKAFISELKVYRSRATSVNVTVGSGATNDIRYQNTSPNIAAAKIKSIVSDSAGNLSAISERLLDVDWTPPACTAIIDGMSTDADTTNLLTSLSASWNSITDANSGVFGYYCAVGTSAGDSNVVAWTNINLDTAITIPGLSLVSGQTYYVSVKTTNGAGQTSVCSTNGILVLQNNNPSSIEEQAANNYFSVQPNPFTESTTIYFYQDSEQPVTVLITDINGKTIFRQTQNYGMGINTIMLNTSELQLAQGIYNLRIYNNTGVRSVKLVKN